MDANEVRPLAIHVIAAFVWGRVRRARRPRLLVVDEAWSLLQHPAGGAFLSGLARRARKHWLGLVTVSQAVADFLADDHGRAVVGNAAVKVLLKQDHTTIGPVVRALDLSAEERRLLLAAGKGDALLCVRGTRVPLRVEASPVEHRLATTAPWELAAAAAAGVSDRDGAVVDLAPAPRRGPPGEQSPAVEPAGATRSAHRAPSSRNGHVRPAGDADPGGRPVGG